MSCCTIAFHATKRSMSTSAGLRSWSWMFFLMRDWFLEVVEPFLLRALALELAREMVVWSRFIDCEEMGREREKETPNCLITIDVTVYTSQTTHNNTDVASYTQQWTQQCRTSSSLSVQCNVCPSSLQSILSISLIHSCTQNTLRWPSRTQLCSHWLCPFSSHHAWCILLCLYSCNHLLFLSSSSHLHSFHFRSNGRTIRQFSNMASHHPITLSIIHR